MCDPVSIAGAALSVGGTMANSAASRNVADARSRALGAERTRQQAYQAQTDNLNTQSRERYDGYGGQQDARSKQLGDYFNQGNSQAPDPAGAGTTANATASALPASGSNLVVAESAKQGAKAAAFGQQQGAALGELRAFGDTMGTINRGVARDAGEIGQVNSFRQGSSAVLPYELEYANHKGDALKTFGDILGGAGRIGVAAGLGANTLGAGAANASTSLPTMAAVPAVGTQTIAGLGRALPQAPLSLGSLFSSALPSFAQPNNAYRAY